MKAPAELWTVARCLGDILDEVVFVGGMIRELLVTDPAAGSARPTDDVDCIVSPISLVEYMGLAARLRARGFAECTDEGAPLCRWVVQGVRVDVMPMDPAVLGFSNIWYPSAVDHAMRVEGPDGSIRIVDAAHFCATKIESFLGRGQGDFFHHDMEDLIAIVDARPELYAEISQAPEDVGNFIVEQMRDWLNDEKFVEALVGHLEGDAASQARRPILLARLRQIAALVHPQSRVPTASSQPAAPIVRPVPTPGRGGQTFGAPSPPPLQVLVRSSNLRAVGYDPSTHALTVEFQNRRLYVYSNVPQNVYDGLIRAGSHGRYFTQWIKDRYSFKRQS